ncbi:hypothetical protein, partial [Treponema sp.]|uniref:hypothetical protein n=1 Tax=Treponema sp. TaxID=166 RepID=UPI0025E7F055
YIGPRKTGAILLAANVQLAAGEMALLIDHNQPKAIIYSPNARSSVTIIIIVVVVVVVVVGIIIV